MWAWLPTRWFSASRAKSLKQPVQGKGMATHLWAKASLPPSLVKCVCVCVVPMDWGIPTSWDGHKGTLGREVLLGMRALRSEQHLSSSRIGEGVPFLRGVLPFGTHEVGPDLLVST